MPGTGYFVGFSGGGYGEGGVGVGLGAGLGGTGLGTGLGAGLGGIGLGIAEIGSGDVIIDTLGGTPGLLGTTTGDGDVGLITTLGIVDGATFGETKDGDRLGDIREGTDTA